MLLALLALAAAPGPAAYPDPLTPAASRQVQCYAPTDHKTCASIAGYTLNSDGTFANVATVLLARQPVVVMRETTSVTIKAGAVCGTVRKEDIASATLTVAGQALTPAQAADTLSRIAAAMDNVIGHEICTTYVPDGKGLVAKATIEGNTQPLPDQKVIWVSPAEGYTVAP